MIDNLGAYIGICLLLNISPGPDMLLCASRALAAGRIAGFATYAGIAMGAVFHALAVALGLGALFALVPQIALVIRLLGVAYLVFLAMQAIRRGTALSVDLRVISIAKSFRQGLITNLLNPKVFFFMLAFLPQFIDPREGNVAFQAVVLAIILALTGLIVNGAVILGADHLRGFMRPTQAAERRLGFFQGGVFLMMALLLWRGGGAGHV